MLRRHLLQDGYSRSLMRNVSAFVARRTIVEILGNARAFRLRGGDNRPSTNNPTWEQEDEADRLFHSSSVVNRGDDSRRIIEWI
jgi:hypothetical protein